MPVKTYQSLVFIFPNGCAPPSEPSSSGLLPSKLSVNVQRAPTSKPAIKCLPMVALKPTTAGIAIFKNGNSIS